MRNIEKVYVLLSIIVMANYCFADLKRLELFLDSTEIKTNEPLVFKMVCEFSQPRIDVDTNEVSFETKHNCFLLVSTNEVDKERIEKESRAEVVNVDNNEYYSMEIFPSLVSMSGKENNIYSDYFIVYMNYYTGSPIFNTPGTYSVLVWDGKIASNVVSLNVGAAIVDRESDFDPNIYVMMSSGSESSIFNDKKYRNEIINKLELESKRNPDSIISYWAAAVVGLQKCKNLKKITNEDTEKNSKLNECMENFDLGIRLPREHSLRRKVNGKLIELEIKRGDFKKAIYYSDEFINDYPNSPLIESVKKRKGVLLETPLKPSDKVQS